MTIHWEQVCVIENPRGNGEIVSAIKKSKSGQLPAAKPPPAIPTTIAAPTTARPSTARPSPTR